jgi:hypothetical protein
MIPASLVREISLSNPRDYWLGYRFSSTLLQKKKRSDPIFERRKQGVEGRIAAICALHDA